ncbi:MAG: hypothetical protein J5725_00420 [Bacteroidales bacterium]|nr:hypothetical protein [Bacteroidales bacterium]
MASESRMGWYNKWQRCYADNTCDSRKWRNGFSKKEMEKKIKVKGNYCESEHEAGRIVGRVGCSQTIKHNHGKVVDTIRQWKRN